MKKILVTTVHPAPYYDKLLNGLKEEFNVEIIYKNPYSLEKQWKIDSSEFNTYSHLSFYRKFIYFKSFELIIFGGWHIKENIFLGILLKLFSKSVIVYALDHPIPSKTNVSIPSILIKKLIFSFSHFLFPASKSCKEYMIKTYKINEDKLVVFPYAHSDAPSNINIINVERNLSLLNNDKIRLFIANRFIERKGYSVIIEAFKKLKELNLLKEFEIDIVGNGSDFEFYKKEFLLLDSKINLLGWVENFEYEILINRCDVYLHASLFEPFGIPPLDALQRGKWLIVSDGVKSTDFFKNIKNTNIFVYKGINSNELTQKLSELVSQKQSLYKNSYENIKLVNEFYSIQTNIKAVKKALCIKKN